MSLFEDREHNFRRNPNLEALLKTLNSDLLPAEKLLLSKYQKSGASEYPIIFVMGPPRSGTTLLMQWLANTGLVAYPSNLLSRFYSAPIIGAKIQLLLTDPKYNFRNELGEFTQQTNYHSQNGKTEGVLAPNEFWYFWRRFLAEPQRDVWTNDELHRSLATKMMLAELAGVSAVFQKPFAAKGMLFNYNIAFLDSIFARALFIGIERDHVNTTASLLEARKRQLGAESFWYSFKIPEYEQLIDLEPVAQCSGQVHYINKAVATGISKLSDERKMDIKYEDFCRNPEAVYQDLLSRLGLSAEVHPYSGPANFSATRSVDPALEKTILQALASFQGRN